MGGSEALTIKGGLTTTRPMPSRLAFFAALCPSSVHQIFHPIPIPTTRPRHATTASVHITLQSANQSRWVRNTEREGVRHRRVYPDVHTTAVYHCAPSYHPQTINIVSHYDTSQYCVQRGWRFTQTARSNYTIEHRAYLCHRHTTLDHLQLITIGHLRLEHKFINKS